MNARSAPEFSDGGVGSGPSDEARDRSARAWAEVQALLDLQLSPLGHHAIEALAPVPGDVVVDIGCGAGQTLLQLADRVGPRGRVIGVDFAPILVDLARRRASGLRHVSVIAADAQTLDLPRGCIDGCFSRFGVMAFADPVAAFANFHRMMKLSGRLGFVCWRSLRENQLDALPLQAAGLEALHDPTPFSFEDPDRVRIVLETAGFHRIWIEPHDDPVSSGDLDAMATVLLRVGPLGRILREDPDLRADAEPRLRAALAAKEAGSHSALTAATWVVSAHA